VLKLGDALTEWRPGAGRPADPLATIRAGWSGIVGSDVARAAQPVALTGSALVVLTTSGAWSHQLAFLERDIIRSVASLGVSGVERLRFRVGTIRTPVPGGAPRRTGMRSGPGPGLTGIPRTAGEALDRLRRVIGGHRAAHATAGGTFCARCQAPIAAATHCRPCTEDDERRRREACERILFEAPWLSSDDVLGAVDGLDAVAYDAIRRRLLRHWIDELRLARKRHAAGAPIDVVRVRKLASSYVVLETRIDPNRLELDSPVRANALGELYPFIREVEAVS
jgi:hypothetical protein